MPVIAEVEISKKCIQPIENFPSFQQTLKEEIFLSLSQVDLSVVYFSEHFSDFDFFFIIKRKQEYSSAKAEPFAPGCLARHQNNNNTALTFPDYRGVFFKLHFIVCYNE